MPSLADAQTGFVATINDGPSALDPSLFAGDPERVILGLKAHANTISHARLVALEDTFPRTREAMGDSEFNQLSRSYCDTAIARALDSNAIGTHFAAHLVAADVEAATIDLARIEWLWLDSYDAAEMDHLELANLAGLDEAALLEMQVTKHPAANILALSAPLSPALEELGGHEGVHAVLISRPETQPVLSPLSRAEAEIFVAAEKNVSIGNLLELSLEQGGEDDALAPVITLINAGALTKVNQGEER